jgi:orotidine-5'-phosphate decarboxylase
MIKTELVVALDFGSRAEAESLMEKLQGLPVIYKVGLELFFATGPGWIQTHSDSGIRIFLDLKFHDIPNTVAQAVVQGARTGAEFLTVHLSGGKRMLDEIDLKLNAATSRGEIQIRPKILGVSVLTSFHDEEWIANVSHMAKISGVRSISDSVQHFASLSHDHPAVQGMVCSPKEVELVRVKHPQLFLMVPGIRPEGAHAHDQSRVMTPKQAHEAGASAIVVGRPITQAVDPRAATLAILGELE